MDEEKFKEIIKEKDEIIFKLIKENEKLKEQIQKTYSLLDEVENFVKQMRDFLTGE